MRSLLAVHKRGIIESKYRQHFDGHIAANKSGMYVWEMERQIFLYGGSTLFSSWGKKQDLAENIFFLFLIITQLGKCINPKNGKYHIFCSIRPPYP